MTKEMTRADSALYEALVKFRKSKSVMLANARTIDKLNSENSQLVAGTEGERKKVIALEGKSNEEIEHLRLLLKSKDDMNLSFRVRRKCKNKHYKGIHRNCRPHAQQPARTTKKK